MDENGVHMDPTQIKVIHDLIAPTTLTNLHSFLGLAKLYHSFMLGFAHITFPLIQVTEGRVKAKFVWDVSQ
jgi:hypothetical protein